MTSTPIVAICAHVDDAHLHAMVTTYRAALGSDRVFVLFDTTASPAPDLPNVHAFSTPACVSDYRFHVDNWQSVECKLGVLRGIVHATGAGTAWMIESDVGCDGDIATCLRSVRDRTSDFMATKVRTRAQDPGWCWWGALAGEIAAMPMEERLGCFFPVTRYSRAMLDLLWEHRDASSGFCEVYVPSLAARHGLVVAGLPEHVIGDIGLETHSALPGRGDHRLYHKCVPSYVAHDVVCGSACAVVCAMCVLAIAFKVSGKLAARTVLE
jgi:hypothetical protein